MNPIDPVILFFLFGLAAGLLRSELKLPSALYESLSIFLLLTIGLKGGQGLATQPLAPLIPQIGAVIVLGVAQTLIAFAVLHGPGRFGRADAAATAAHYGSVSVATFAVVVAWLGARNIAFEPQMAILLVIMEIPAILVGIVLARGVSRQTDWRALGHEAFLGKGVTLLLGGMAIGWAAGPDGLAPVKGLFFDLFKGVLALFLLEMGLIVSRQVGELKRRGIVLIAFGLGMPLLSALLGLGTGMLLGLSVGGLTVLATLAASASYIAVPAAIRIAVPEANPAISLAGSLGVTFPFNILAGIPLYHWLAGQLAGAAP
ncbi:sodium-dependent bicarbonate transport family permease [Thauera sp. WB-2]|uniref:sodium-dependent bicarbonate transport family permease n=1 Tax=Thauera sp. WB-2 TaxID=2897772 RepID=UPI0022DD1362|nr:sodium-dependent bicarbonate transport family permease [Thauera sp. WB-2]WBL64135.1 sodium-dependent bicarbonate transport family permease [Thauera sp. WB-2]